MNIDWEPYTGRKIVCVCDAWRKHKFAHLLTFPRRDVTYTIREWCWGSSPSRCNWVFLRLLEVVNPIMQFDDAHGEANFDARFFRPVDERETDISVFERLLVPAGRQKEDA